MRIRSRRMLVGGMLTAALGVTLAACGSSSNKVKTVQAASIPSKPESGVIRMGIEPWIGYGPWYIAQKEGYFQKHGRTVAALGPLTEREARSAWMTYFRT